jgi:hypothetical protein
LALLAATGVLLVGGASAQAADLGGDCCADLEERVAELEATTARKGNRKVSLTVSGWVNEAVFAWDDGVESNAYVGTNSLEQSRFKLAGEAKISSDWSAGYTIELGINGAASNTFSQTSAGTGNNITTRKSSWFLKSKSLGKVTVGQDGTSTYHLLDDADGANTRNYSDAEAATVALAQFSIRSGGSFVNSLQWRDLTQGFNNDTPGQDGRRNIVRYDSPTFAGFSASASWGEDDIWDMALTYKGEVGDFKLVGKLGYGESNDPSQVGGSGANCGVVAGVNDQDCSWWGAAGTVMHAPTGLYVYGGYGEQDNKAVDGVTPAGAALTADGTSTVWFVQAGIEQKWLPLGKTTVFGEFRHDDAGSNLGKNTGGGAANYVQSADLDFWAAGVVQNIDSAAMDLYVIYRHSDGDFTNGQNVKTELDDFDMLITGARIQF